MVFTSVCYCRMFHLYAIVLEIKTLPSPLLDHAVSLFYFYLFEVSPFTLKYVKQNGLKVIDKVSRDY